MRLRVIWRKSAYLTFSVTVRPRRPVASLARQTLSRSGASPSLMLPISIRSEKKVVSAPIDLRMRSARTARESMPREME